MISRNPILIYQMGKVGSSTIRHSLARALEDTGLDIPVHHIHALNNLEEIEEAVIRERPSPGPTLRVISQGKEIRQAFAARSGQQWNVISLVREPVGRNVGAFFENLKEILPGWRNQMERGELSLVDLRDLFLKTSSIHYDPLLWFDDQLKPVIGIDVFLRKFPKEAGYLIYPETKRFRLLVLRLEDLSRCAGIAIKKFIGLEDFKILSVNLGATKNYAEIYSNFKMLPLPQEYIEKMYSSKYAQHFYSPGELDEFRQKWINVGRLNESTDD